MLLLVRHGESEWNVLGKWTGNTDVHLTKKGQNDAERLGQLIRDIPVHHAYTSELIRTMETLSALLLGSSQADVPSKRVRALNERDYGDYTGLNKWDVLEQLGEDTFHHIRRSWDHPIPNGETLQMVHERVVPFYKEHILPLIKADQNVLIVSHGNTLRALIKHLEHVSDEGVSELEMAFGEVLLYEFDQAGHMARKEIRRIETKLPHA